MYVGASFLLKTWFGSGVPQMSPSISSGSGVYGVMWDSRGYWQKGVAVSRLESNEWAAGLGNDYQCAILSFSKAIRTRVMQGLQSRWE